jgi:putative membrane protein
MMHDQSNRERSFHAFLRGIIMFGFSMLMLGLILSGGIRYYIAPHMMPFVYFGMITFLILSIVQIWRSTSKKQDEDHCDCGADHEMKGPALKKALIYFIFIFPLLVGFTIPDQMLGSSVASNRGIQLGSSQAQVQPDSSATAAQEEQVRQQEQTDPEQPKTADEYLAEIDQIRQEFEQDEHFTFDETYNFDGFNDYYSEQAAKYANEDRIVITDDNFLDMMAVLELYLDEFVGKEIEIVGFVLRLPEFEADQMVAARFAMTCCVADVMPYGLLTQGEITRNFMNDTWVRVRGTIGMTDDPYAFDDEYAWKIPLIDVTEIEEVDEPEHPYVYPSFF